MGSAYLDNAATTPLSAAAADAMQAVIDARLGNPSGAHRLARRAQEVLDEAREVVADALGGPAGGVVFTGGGTEADNLAVRGVLGASGGLAVCPAAEHHAVLHPVQQANGRVVGLTTDGRVDLDRLAEALDPDVRVVSVMAVNNENGMIQPLEPIRELIDERAPAAVLHTDAVQGAPWLDLVAHTTPADLVSISAHKFGGPAGVGALLVRGDVELAPQLVGGGQERGRRAGTHNVAGIAGMAAALAATVGARRETGQRVGRLRDRLADALLAEVDDCVETGVRAAKVAGNCHLCFSGIESEALLFLLEQQEVYASAAASCSSGAQEPSHVLAAMGYPRQLAGGSLRLSLGPTTTEADVERAVAVIPPAVARLRERDPLQAP
ncbi:MAG: cysteine desulfurase [Acidimicrobiia bacterium]|nr:cysteine desulfurase [Acidimicrobiia bacterium]MDH5238693.1 cysteine desulfurase [Acidimicrobiia bacterium]